jgi:hypothetical protein
MTIIQLTTTPQNKPSKATKGKTHKIHLKVFSEYKTFHCNFKFLKAFSSFLLI